MPTEQETMEERRRYFRVRDRVILTWREVDEDALRDAALDDGRYQAVNLEHALIGMDRQLDPIIAQVKERAPDLGEGLEVINNKINLLAQALTAREENLFEEHALEVDLSGNGIGFPAPRELPPGTLLRLEMTLFPSYAIIRAFAQVVECRREGGGFEVAAEFLDLPEERLEVLMQHLFRRQGEELRRQRDAYE